MARFRRIQGVLGQVSTVPRSVWEARLYGDAGQRDRTEQR